MKRTILFVLLSAASVVGFSENVRFKQFGTPIPERADLDVRWNAPANAFPPKIWVYHLLPRNLSPQIISNLMTLCSFSGTDKTGTGDTLEFKTVDGSRRLWISYGLGTVHYENTIHFNPTNLVKGLPTEKEAVNLTKKILPTVGVGLSDIDKKDNTSEPSFHVANSEWVTFVKPETITNTYCRTVRFRRTVDGFLFVSVGTGGDGDIRFGDNGKVIKMDLSWRNMERGKSYPTLSPEKMIKSLRDGKAVQGLLLVNSGGINWRTVKSVTVNLARPCYYAGDSMQPSDWLEPYAELDTVVDTGHGNIRVEIDCPIIDE
jgi:hypothetical protein